MKKLLILLTCLYMLDAYSQSTNPVYLNYNSTLGNAIYISSSGSNGNQPGIFFHLPYVGTTGNAVFEWDADDSGNRMAIYRFSASGHGIFEIRGWNDGSKSDFWFGDNDNDKFYISDDGNVGIGTSSPQSKLDIGSGIIGNSNYNDITIGNATTNAGIQIYAGTSSHSGISFHNTAVSSTSRTNYDGGVYYNHGAQEFQIWANKAQRITIDSQGYLGIGTTTPTSALQVMGDIAIDYGKGLKIDTDWNGAGGDYILNTGYDAGRGGDFLDLYVPGNGEHHKTAKLSLVETGKLGIGTTSPKEILQIGDRWTFHSGGHKVFGYNYHYDAGSKRIVNDEAAYIRFSNDGDIRFETAPYDLAGTTISPTYALVLKNNGNVGMGVLNPDSKLVVDGTIKSEEVKVEIIDGPDYVFAPDYQLRSLEETQAYIVENQHLPEIPSAAEMEVNGIELGDMNMRLLKKIEELTLYQIELLKEVNNLKKEVAELKSK